MKQNYISSAAIMSSAWQAPVPSNTNTTPVVYVEEGGLRDCPRAHSTVKDSGDSAVSNDFRHT